MLLFTHPIATLVVGPLFVADYLGEVSSDDYFTHLCLQFHCQTIANSIDDVTEGTWQ